MQTFKHKLLILSCLVLFFGFLLFALPAKQKAHTLCISCKSYDDEILAELVTILIEHKTPYSVKRHYNLGSTFMTFNALKANDIDLYPEYTGTIIYGILDSKYMPKEPIAFIKKGLEKYQLDTQLFFGFSNSYVICVTKAFAQTYNIKTLSDLKTYTQNHPFKVGMDAEFIARQDYTNLITAYDLQWNPILMDSGLLYLNLTSNELDFIVANELDDEIKRFDLYILEDDKEAMPPYESLLLTKKDLFQKYPELEDTLALLENQISKEEYQALNARLRNSQADLHDVALAFLKEKGIIY